MLRVPTGGQWVSTPFLKTAFAERVLWPNKLERHLITTSSLSWQITSHISTLKALTSPVAEMPVQHFQNLFDCRTLKSWPFLYPRHQSYYGQPLGNPSLSVFMGASSVKDKFAIFFHDDSDLFSVEHKICFHIVEWILSLTKSLVFPPQSFPDQKHLL